MMSARTNTKQDIHTKERGMLKCIWFIHLTKCARHEISPGKYTQPFFNILYFFFHTHTFMHKIGDTVIWVAYGSSTVGILELYVSSFLYWSVKIFSMYGIFSWIKLNQTFRHKQCHLAESRKKSKYLPESIKTQLPLSAILFLKFDWQVQLKETVAIPLSLKEKLFLYEL